MKHIFRKNQMMIAVLALMIAVAGYLNFTSDELQVENQDVSSGYYDGAVGNSDDTVISANLDDSVQADDEYASEAEMDDAANDDSINTDEIGETVLTSATVTENFLSEAKLNREQMRAKSKEILNDIIDNETLSEEAKSDAVSQLIALTDAMQKESQAEQQLGLKGFTDAIVSISEDSVDVSIAVSELTESEKAQIEDIVMRKTGCDVSEIVITTMGN